MATTWAEFETRGLSGAEAALVRACKAGTPCLLGLKRPEGPDPKRTICADLLRFLILGGDEGCRVHEGGVELVGAFIEGPLNLSCSAIRRRTRFPVCRFNEALVAQRCVLQALDLSGSALPGLIANGTTIEGDLRLVGSVITGDGLVLARSQVQGDIECHGASLFSRSGYALNAEGARVGGSVSLHNRFKAFGGASFSGAAIVGQFTCEHGTFLQRQDVIERGEWYALNMEGT